MTTDATTKPVRVLDGLATALREAARVNQSVNSAPAAVLWTDQQGQWKSALPQLRQAGLTIFTLGPYDEAALQGPAIWLKCAVAGALPQLPQTPPVVVYLPGVSRADLRAIESCPRELQPLAELQYRGAFWSQTNGKDWTVSAFLASRHGGLGLDVGQDRATQEALAHTLEAGVLLERPVAELAGRQIQGEWLHSLLAPNPTRDVLVWLNDPDSARAQWGDVRWKIFARRCKTDFRFDPEADGVLAAAELLAQRTGKWAAVAELYRDSFTSFPAVFELLSKVRPPQLVLFQDAEQISGYPQANEQYESTLRYELMACAQMDAPQARTAVATAEKEHAPRRDWVWSRMGCAPLAMALEHLAAVAMRSSTAPIGQTPEALAASYQQDGWQVDAAALNALASVQSKADIAAVSAALRAMYLPWTEEAARRLQQATREAGGLPPLPANDIAAAAGTCLLFVDGLRYDVARALQSQLDDLGPTTLTVSWTSLPSVTASGKAWCSPVSQWITGNPDDQDFEPRVAADGRPLSAHHFRKLLAEHGFTDLDAHETGDPQGAAWTETGDLDHYGHQHGTRLARDLPTQLNQIVERVKELRDAGWKQVRIVTDHGWLLMPGGLPKAEMPLHQVETRWGRCAILKDSAAGTPLTFGWDWCKDVQVAYAPGASTFIAGAEYAHGGISLQECLVPTLHLAFEGETTNATPCEIEAISWKGLRCTVVVTGALPGWRVDIRTKANLASTSLAQTKPLVEGRASLAVDDDGQMGSIAVVVVLNADGEVLQKQATTVGD